MPRFYISFGQAHAHAINGMTFDKDSLMLVEAPGELVARVGLNQITGGKWCGLYQESDLPKLRHYFPRGVINEHCPVEFHINEFRRIGDRLVRNCDGNHPEPPCADPECWQS